MSDRKMIVLYLTGDTYSIKEYLKADGFRWSADDNAWYKNFFLDEPNICFEYVKNLAEAFETTSGIYAEITGDIDV